MSEAPRPLAALRPDVPPELSGAIMRALAKKPDDRWKDAEAFRDAVAGIGAPAAVATAWAVKAVGAAPAARPPAAPLPRLTGAG